MISDILKILSEFEADAIEEAEKFGKNSKDDWGPGFTERVQAETILLLVRALRIAIEDLNSVRNINQDDKTQNFLTNTLDRIESILEGKE